MIPSTDRTQAWRLAALAAAFLVFSSPRWWITWKGEWPSFMPATVALTTLLLVIVATWQRVPPARAHERSSRGALAVGAIACGVIAAAAWHWIALVLSNPIDPVRADMLPVIAAALRRFLHGGDPYTIYRVPWEAPLGYGPVLWGAFLIPHFLRADLRLATVAGQLAVPLWCGLAAIVESARGRWWSAALWVVVLASMVASPDLAAFATVGHTPVFWPLLPVFALFLDAERWYAAAFLLGVIVVGRSTMVAGVPIFLMRVWVADRTKLPRAIAALAVPVLLLMGPFAVWDPHALWYGMVAVYPTVIKKVVWPSPDGGIFHTIGVTGWLVAHHLERFVEVTQAILVGAAWVCGWIAIRRGARPLPWMGLAVFAFCAATLWPLYYIYLDVLLFFVAAAVAESLDVRSVRTQWLAWPASVLAASAIVIVGVRAQASSFPTFDFTSAGSSEWLYQGFATSRRAGEPALPWIWGLDATVALPRSSRVAADILVRADPVLPPDTRYQAVTVTLNQRLLGTVHAERGWQTLRFAAPADAWIIGSNELKLVCSTVARPLWIGMSDDPRQLSLALRRIDVVPLRDDRAAR